ncbi:STAS domain-containing protein [Phytophthora infestans]|uniref:STAS domain-containing protein n=1 Tax=Phytophthora infestans TaxID=4787 RepID=A0A8S9V154_PHYIN|nr:STAS domain-containing protein [Phytophthora infestans]
MRRVLRLDCVVRPHTWIGWLIASIVCSVLALMINTPVVILGELENGGLVDRDVFPDAQEMNGIVVVLVESSLYFANCERVEREMAHLAKQNVTTRGVVLDAYHMSDMDATKIQVLSDT